MRKVAFALGLLMVGSATTAWAADFPSTINEPPRGPGTEAKTTMAPVEGRVVPGWEVAGQIGGGVGFGLGARAGYTLSQGVYLGGSFTHFWGSSVATVNGDQRTSQNFLGGDVGYKLFFADRKVEVRPFVFLGAGFTHEHINETNTMVSNTGFAIQPGVLGAYHFGPAFVSAELKVLITPTPVHIGAFGGFGLSL